MEFKGEVSALAVSQGGIWLRQGTETGQSVIHATHVLQQGRDIELRNVIVFIYEGANVFLGRVDAEIARLEDGFWHMTDARISAPEQPPKFEKEYWLATDLTLDKIQDSLATPETMSFWDLPELHQHARAGRIFGQPAPAALARPAGGPVDDVRHGPDRRPLHPASCPARQGRCGSPPAAW